MEAVPRLPMISFQLKVSTENASFGQPLKQYIAQFYGEDPESYNNEIHNLECLRSGAVRPTLDIEGIQLLKRYYCQLHFLKSRFPMEELQAAAVYFSWQDSYSTMACTIPDIRFELMCILYNIGALHTQLGAEDQRVTPDGMKIACTHFQCAAWAFQVLRESYYQMVTYISAVEVVHFMELTCLAQAQECILEKSMMDNRKASIIAKVAVQVVDYYKKAQLMLQGGVDENNYSDYVQLAVFKEWVQYLNFKVTYHRCITMLYQGQQAEELQKMGERVAFYQAAAEQLEKARKLSLGLDKKQDIMETLAFTSDFIEGKKKAAKNENDFIYHEEIPNKDTFPEVKGASLVKGIPFIISDIEVSGPDLFARLIPMEAHEASSLYSERKASLLRKYGEIIEQKDQKLVEFMSSLQIEFLNDMRQATGIPQGIVDRAAALSARPNAIQDLINAMARLSNSFQEVESLLKEIDILLKEEEQSEKEYQRSVGERPPSIIATDLSREAAKYKEAHNKANESNQNLHRAMIAHVGNLKMLSQPLNQLQLDIPSVKMPDPNIDESALKEVEMLLSKVEEMKTQRSVLWAQLRDSLHSDDITRVLVTKEANQNTEEIFSKELEKHKHLTTLLEQNTTAQDNIIEAFIDAYARFSSTRRYIQGIITKRQSTINSLISSYETYEDLLSKANKGIEFYSKLETNVSKLLQRIKSSYKVQQEEREHVLSKITAAPTTETNPSESSSPKLKDYLESMKKKTVMMPVTSQPYSAVNLMGNIPNTNETQIWPPGIRPTPLGSEINEPSISLNETNIQSPTNKQIMHGTNSAIQKVNEKLNLMQQAVIFSNQQFYSPIGMSNQYLAGSHNTQALPSFEPDHSLEKRLNALKLNNEDINHYPPYQQFNDQSFSNYCNSGNTSFNKTDALLPPGSTNLSLYNQQNPSINSFETTPISGHPLNLENKSFIYPATAEVSSLQITNQTNNFLQNQINFCADPKNSPTTQAGNSCFYGSNSVNNLPASTMNPATHFSSYIPKHYAFANQVLPDSTNFENELNPSNSIYASGYAISQNFQSSGLATVQSNGYYSTEVASKSDQIKGIYSGSHEASQACPLTSVESDSYYSYGTFPINYPISSDGAQLQNSNIVLPNNLVNQNFEISPRSFNQSQYSEGYVGPGSFIAPNQYNPSYMYTQAGMNYSYNPNNTSSSNGGLTSHLSVQNSDVNNLSISNKPSDIAVQRETKKEYSTYDLLSDIIESSISQLPLEPEQTKVGQKENNQITLTSDQQSHSVNTVSPEMKSQGNIIQLEPHRTANTSTKVIPSKPLDDESVKKLFSNEVDKFEKFVDQLNNKTLNGSTNLEMKWKEIQDTHDCDAPRKNISVARCYPMKNRFPDILPYDHSRVILESAEDDYINASYIQGISSFVPSLIVTQTPLQNTIVDFWTMVLEQNIKFIMCLVTTNEITGEIYWPQEKKKDLHVANIVVSLQSISFKTYWIERIISISNPERKITTTVIHMQFTDWSESLLPTSPYPFVSFVKELLILYRQQQPMSSPILIHCLSGIGRSGVASLLIYTILEATNSAVLPDLTYLANKISLYRKNIIRDREHLKFFYSAFLVYMKHMISDNGNISNSEDKEGEKCLVAPAKDDPLSSLDPFWATKKK